jgi:hypothetical protein
MQGSDSWKKKMHPLFLETARAYSDAVKELEALGPKPAAEKAATVQSHLQNKLGKILVRYRNPHYTPSAPDPLEVILSDWQPSIWPPSEIEMDFGQSEVLYWQRFREPLKIALCKRKTGDLKAFRRISRIGEDRFALQFGKGPIKRSKTDPDHDVLFGLGLDLGLSALTEEELANCFDAVCPCGKSHDPDSLKQQRRRKNRELKKARMWLASEAAKIPACERMAVYGAHEVYARAAHSTELPQRRVYIGEIGKWPACYIDERGDAFNLKGSKVASAVAEGLPGGFCLSTSRELFAMFFPPKRKGSSHKAKP